MCSVLNKNRWFLFEMVRKYQYFKYFPLFSKQESQIYSNISYLKKFTSKKWEQRYSFSKFLISNSLKGLNYTAVFIKKQFQCRKEEHCSRQAYFLLKKDWYDLYIMTSKPFKRCDPVYLSLLMLSVSHIWQVGGPTC